MEDRSITVSASDIEKATERGLARLGLTRQEVNIDVIDQGSKGILGIGARDAVVRLTPIATPGDSAKVLPSQAAEAERDVEVKQAEPSREDEEGPSKPEPEEEYALSDGQVAEIARQTLSELLGKMGIECQVIIREQEEDDGEPAPLTLDVFGEGLDSLIGRQGEVLNALQYITRLIVSREVEHWVNVIVDVDRYKQRRAQSLRELARRIAERVARTKQPVALEPMPPNERRVIHIALHDHPAVTTQSVGRGDSRKVTIIPKR